MSNEKWKLEFYTNINLLNWRTPDVIDSKKNDNASKICRTHGLAEINFSLSKDISYKHYLNMNFNYLNFLLFHLYTSWNVVGHYCDLWLDVEPCDWSNTAAAAFFLVWNLLHSDLYMEVNDTLVCNRIWLL